MGALADGIDVVACHGYIHERGGWLLGPHVTRTCIATEARVACQCGPKAPGGEGKGSVEELRQLKSAGMETCDMKTSEGFIVAVPGH